MAVTEISATHSEAARVLTTAEDHQKDPPAHVLLKSLSQSGEPSLYLLKPKLTHHLLSTPVIHYHVPSSSKSTTLNP